MFNKFFFFFKTVPFMRHVEEFCSAGQATDYNTVHAQCMLDI